MIILIIVVKHQHYGTQGINIMEHKTSTLWNTRNPWTFQTAQFKFASSHATDLAAQEYRTTFRLDRTQAQFVVLWRFHMDTVKSAICHIGKGTNLQQCVDYSIYTIKSTNTFMWNVFITCHSLPTCFNYCRRHRQSRLQDLKEFKQTVGNFDNVGNE